MATVTKTEWYFIKDANVYGGPYTVYKDDGTTTSGMTYFTPDNYGQEVELDSDDGVYTDGKCAYTKDSDGNPVYHDFEAYFNTFINMLGYSTGSDTSIVSYNIIDNNGAESTLTKSLIDDFTNGVCDASTDDYNLTISVIDRNIVFEPKTDGYKFAGIQIPYSSMLVSVFNKNVGIDLPEKRFTDIQSNINTLASNVSTYKDDIITETDNNKTAIINEIDTTTNNLSDTMATNKTDIINQITTSEDNVNTDITNAKDDAVQQISDKFDDIKVEITSLNGSSGAVYNDGDIVTIKGFNDNWKIMSSFLALNERSVLKVAYKVQKENSTDNMMVFQALIDTLVQEASNNTSDSSSNSSSS